MTEEQIDVCKEILKKFIYKVRSSEINQYVFHYYTDSYIDSESNSYKTYPVNTPEYYKSFNFDRTKRQIKTKILTNKSNYWNFDEKKVRILEDVCINHSEEFDNNLKEYIENLWTCSLEEQTKEFEKKEQEFKEKKNTLLKEALGTDKYNIYIEVINLILDDTVEYPYKSDKIKILLEIELDVETIFKILQTKEKWKSPRSYIEKYYKERQEGIKQRKINVYDLDSTIKHITNQLKNHK